MIPQLDAVSATIAFVAVIAVGIIGLEAMPVGMTTETVLMMVAPSMIVFGGIMFVLGVAHGQHRVETAT